MSFSFIDLIREFLEIVGAITIISKVISYLVGRRELRKIEESYSKARGYIEEKLPDMSFTLNYLPDAIVLEKATKGERGLSSILTTGIKKIIQKIKGRHYYHIIVFDDLSLPQQIAFILKKTFEAIFPFQNVLEIDLRECLVIYYSYKFAKASEKLVGTETIDLLEKELQKNRYKDMIINLDSKELESNITLNPPPEIRPLLDRVIIPILRLKAQKMASITDISMIESTKTKMRNFLDRLSRGLIGVLFIGRKILKSI